MKKTIGILGGMGPLATADLYRMIVESTRADCDNDHIRVYIDSNPAIPDRTAAILRGGKDPVPEMLSALRNLEKCGADCVIMPCNTAHYFLPRLQKETSLPILDMPAIAAARCAGLFPGKRACILATKGTLESGVYACALEREDVPFMTPEEAERDELMRLIYDVVKASKPIAPEKENWQRLLAGLRPAPLSIRRWSWQRRRSASAGMRSKNRLDLLIYHISDLKICAISGKNQFKFVNYDDFVNKP